jgi:hypothetical protein
MGILLIYVSSSPPAAHHHVPCLATRPPSEQHLSFRLPQDVNNPKSLQNIRNWVRNIEGNAPQTINKILIGNKCAARRPRPRLGGLACCDA